MQCPICPTSELVPQELEAGLTALQCPTCEGRWIPSSAYWQWYETHGDNLPEKPAEDGLPLEVHDDAHAHICPECGHILLRYKVGHSIDFLLDHCGSCGGTWYAHNEWEILKSRNLHDDAHFIFSQPWQAALFQEERAKAHERQLLERFGEDDLAELRRIKGWINQHPRKEEVIAFLLN